MEDRINKYNNRINKLRCYMEEKGYDYYIVFSSDPHLSEYINDTDKFREYITGFTGSAGTLVISKEDAFLFVDGRYHIQAEKETKELPITIMKLGLSGVKNPFEFLGECAELSGKIKIGADGRYLSVRELELLKKITIKNAVIDLNGTIDEAIWPNRPKRAFQNVRHIGDSVLGVSANTKIESIKSLIRDKHKEVNNYCYIISDLCSIMWTLNLRGKDINYVPVAFSYMIITDKESAVYLNKKSLSDECLKYLSNNNVQIIEYDLFYEDLLKIKNQNVLIDYKKNNSLIFELLKANNTITCTEDYELIKKYIKNEAEIDAFRKYHINDAVSVIRFIKELKRMVADNSKVTEYEAALLMDSIRLSDKDCFMLSFETISAYGKNAALPHYSAKEDECDTILNKGFYLVDCGGHYPSCTTDITRTIALGGLSDREKKMYTLVLKGNLNLMDAVFIKGTRGENIDIIARLPLYKEGLDFMHGVGHGIGSALSVHEGPIAIRSKISNELSQPFLEPGMVISDEPGIYLENEMGIRLENELLVVEKQHNKWGSFLGFEVLTLVPFDLAAIDEAMLDDNEKRILNSYHKLVYEKISPQLNEDEKKWLYENTAEI